MLTQIAAGAPTAPSISYPAQCSSGISTAARPQSHGTSTKAVQHLSDTGRRKQTNSSIHSLPPVFSICKDPKPSNVQTAPLSSSRSEQAHSSNPRVIPVFTAPINLQRADRVNHISAGQKARKQTGAERQSCLCHQPAQGCRALSSLWGWSSPAQPCPAQQNRALSPSRGHSLHNSQAPD